MVQQCAALVRWVALIAVMSDGTAVCCIGAMDSFNSCDELVKETMTNIYLFHKM
jgi:hypothetical protein